jgi:glycogen operon protein
MILAGDEFRRTQRGNNNAYCQDSDISWIDWTLTSHHSDLLRFVRLLIARRVLRSVNAESLSLVEWLRESKHAWHGVRLFQPDWSPSSHALAFGAELARENLQLHLILNAYWEPLDFELPHLSIGESWRRWIDTSLESPHDISDWQDAEAVSGFTYRAAPRSTAVLVAGPGLKQKWGC